MSRLTNLRTEYLRDPLGIDIPNPRFSYLRDADSVESSKAKQQTSYRILAATRPELLHAGKADLWDSGICRSRVTYGIRYGGKPLNFGDCCYWTIEATDDTGEVTRADREAFFTVGFLRPDDIQAKFIYYDQPIGDGELAAPVCFAKSVRVRKKVRRAMLYASALGVMRIFIDGQPVSENVLAPEWVSYYKRVQYQTYDVTDKFDSGECTLTAVLSNGWYCGLWQKWPPRPHIYGGKYPEFLCRLVLEYEDGSCDAVATDDTWKASTRLPWRFAGIYEGETFDARIPMPSMGEPVWQDVRESDAQRRLSISAQRSEPIAVTQTLRPVAITQPKPGVYVVDFGQNFAGRVRARFHEAAGSTVTLKHNEVLNPDGTLYTDNLVTCEFTPGADRQTVRYTCRGYDDTYAPSFTYMGFRYAEITGLSGMPSADDFTGEVFHTAFAPAGEFECSDPLINRLRMNIDWSHRSNTMGVPTDCPSRDERCGYTGDMQFFMPTAVLNRDMAAFMNKWLVDLCEDSQFPDGSFKDHAPDFGMNGGIVGWGDAGIICPYICMRTYDDRQTVSEHYSGMKRYVEWLVRTANGDGTRGPECVGLGDWLSMGGGADKAVIGTAYYAYMLRLFCEMAQAIGKTDDGAALGILRDQAARAFGERFILPDGTVKDSSLTGYALAVTMDLVPSEKCAALKKAFADEVLRQNCRLTTGFMGTPRLLTALSEIGRDDLAETLLFQRECPSWLYPVTVGATTVWERWNGWTEKDGFECAGMNSFNHFAFGSVGEYLFRCILGISQQNGKNGYSHAVVRPSFLSRLSFAEGSYLGMNGKLSVKWQKSDGKITLTVTVPFNTTARVILPYGASIAGKAVPLSPAASDGSATTPCGGGDWLCAFDCPPGKHIFTLPNAKK